MGRHARSPWAGLRVFSFRDVFAAGRAFEASVAPRFHFVSEREDRRYSRRYLSVGEIHFRQRREDCPHAQPARHDITRSADDGSRCQKPLPTMQWVSPTSACRLAVPTPRRNNHHFEIGRASNIEGTMLSRAGLATRSRSVAETLPPAFMPRVIIHTSLPSMRQTSRCRCGKIGTHEESTTSSWRSRRFASARELPLPDQRRRADYAWLYSSFALTA